MKKCYIAIVAALEQIYEDSHEPEAIGINKILMKPTTLFAIYLLDFVLPHVLLPAANWVLELQDIQDQMKNSPTFLIVMKTS